MTTVLVTGSRGFVGSALTDALRARGYDVLAPSRDCWLAYGRPNTADGLLDGVDAVVHLAARAHVLEDRAADPIGEFRRANVDCTRQLAEACATARVPRFVFVSSIGVHGNESGKLCLDERSPIAPCEPYALSKWEAELALREIEARSELEVTVVRPPLVYGPRVKGNFLRLLRLLDSFVPVPLGSVRNLRSFVGLDNLCDALCLCVRHPAAGGGTFIVADGEDLSTPELLCMLRRTLQRPARIWRCPLGPLRAVARLCGRERELRQLTASLTVDAALAKTRLGWRPRHSVADGIGAMVRWYRDEVRR